MGMELSHEFTVPASVEETWTAFNDIATVAGCFPGAMVSSVDGDSFQGSCKVKLGPIALVYNGSGTFVEKDETAHRMVIDAKGKDKRGNGTAGAHVTATMTQEGESTRVGVLTDLAITGKPAQFGRGVIQDVSDKLLGQFTDCLAKQVGAPSDAAAEAPGESTEATPAGGAAQEGQPRPEVVDPEVRMHNMRDLNLQQTAPGEAAGSDDGALDLGATVLPVLARTYWKHALALLVTLFVLRRLLRRG